ncbi:LPS translocon maturation chaperone LptM [Marinobacter mobilis]|uniref:Lipoprotein-attachment site-containing protein n=1 Tax=Marinobacter mobilis TaxID=488533 RepID=A0A1H2XNI0_9GAMM|nr:lipoprotein [Marinobacter mobilis]SDW94393.1 lipoprotein-attachment site-containing protein [Marinobacter mobilis]
MGHRVFFMAVLMAAQLLAGCGQKGPLYRDSGLATAATTEVSGTPAERDDEQTPADDN